MENAMNRRDFLTGTCAVALFGGLSEQAFAQEMAPLSMEITPDPEAAFAAEQERLAQEQGVPVRYLPREVPIMPGIPANEVHVDPNRFAMYFTQGNGTAIRYTCGIGRRGLYESGTFFIGAKKEWPSWTPTPDMIARDPGHYAQYSDGMPGGPDNPLGARALYLFKPQIGDSFLRLHGTNAPGTIGTRVSNGCARLVNPHIINLYERVALQARVILYPADDRVPETIVPAS